jgi:hypothetical protein
MRVLARRYTVANHGYGTIFFKRAAILSDLFSGSSKYLFLIPTASAT